jgi:hypothetical protein
MPEGGHIRRGPYVPLASNYYLDDRVMKLTPVGEVLFTRMLAFCSSSMSDGFFTEDQLKATVGLVRRYGQAKVELVSLGLWTKVEDPDGYRVTSWLKWNPPVAAIRAAHEADAARKRRERSGWTPPGQKAASKRTPENVLISSTVLKDKTRPPSGSGRVLSPDGRSQSSLNGASRPSEDQDQKRPSAGLGGIAEELKKARERIEAARVALNAKTARRPNALAELLAFDPPAPAAEQPADSDSGDQK